MAAVEFALVAPLFVIMILGMIEVGRAVMVQQVLTNASREGARIAVLNGTTPDQVRTAVSNYLQSASISGAVVDPGSTGSAGYGAPVTVTVTIPFGQVSWLPAPIFITRDTALTASTVMRRETVQ